MALGMARSAAGRLAGADKGKLWAAGTLGMGALAVPANMSEGDSFRTAVVRAGAETAAWAVAPYAMGAYEVGKLAVAGVEGGHAWHQNKKSAWNEAHRRNTTVGGNYQDTQRAATMRQASIEAISGSKMNARSALGGEAQLLSSNWR